MSCTAVGRFLSNDGIVSFRLASGMTFGVPWHDRYWVGPLLLERQYEREIDALLTQLLRPEDWFFDCGANAGLWSVAAASVINDANRVVAVEAGKAAFTMLQGNNDRNGGCCTALHRALTASGEGSVELFANGDDLASSSLVRTLAPQQAVGEAVDAVSLDALLSRRAARPPTSATFVKLDIEGMEAEVLAGLDPEIHGDLLVLYEDHGRDAASAATTSLLERGFHVAYLQPDERPRPISSADLAELRTLKADANRGYNLVAVAPHGVGHARLTSMMPAGVR